MIVRNKSAQLQRAHTRFECVCCVISWTSEIDVCLPVRRRSRPASENGQQCGPDETQTFVCHMCDVMTNWTTSNAHRCDTNTITFIVVMSPAWKPHSNDRMNCAWVRAVVTLLYMFSQCREYIVDTRQKRACTPPCFAVGTSCPHTHTCVERYAVDPLFSAGPREWASNLASS